MSTRHAQSTNIYNEQKAVIIIIIIHVVCAAVATVGVRGKQVLVL
jgi:hypothetical protein